MTQNVTQLLVCDLRHPDGVIRSVAPTDGELVGSIDDEPDIGIPHPAAADDGFGGHAGVLRIP